MIKPTSPHDKITENTETLEAVLLWLIRNIYADQSSACSRGTVFEDSKVLKRPLNSHEMTESAFTNASELF